jgi:hypothetical protein
MVNTCLMLVPLRFLTVSSVNQVTSAQVLVPRLPQTALQDTTVLRELALLLLSALLVSTAQLMLRLTSSATMVPSQLMLDPFLALPSMLEIMLMLLTPSPRLLAQRTDIVKLVRSSPRLALQVRSTLVVHSKKVIAAGLLLVATELTQVCQLVLPQALSMMVSTPMTRVSTTLSQLVLVLSVHLAASALVVSLRTALVAPDVTKR